MWLFGKKQSRANENNQKKDELLKDIGDLQYLIDQHRYAENLDADYMSEVGEQLRGYIQNFKYVTFTYEDNIDTIAGKIRENVRQLRKAINAGLTSRVKSAAKDLSDNFEDLKTGHFDGGNPDEDNAPKQSSQQQKLDKKLKELESIKKSATAKINDLIAEKKKLTSEKEELEDMLCDAEDDDIANDLDRRISACEEKISTKSALMGSYSNCATRLDSLRESAEGFYDMGEEQLRRVNAYLDMEKIRAVLSEPNSLDTVCKGICSEIGQLRSKVSRSDDSRARQAPEGSSTITDRAEKRREELRNKRRQKEENAKNMETIDHILDEKDTTVTQEVK